MSYQTHYLRFNSQEEAEAKLEEVNYRHTETFDGEEHTYYAVRDQVGDVDIIGDIYNDDGVYDEETLEMITPPTKMDGWHVNIILQSSLSDELKPFVVTPNNPYRVFA